MKAVRLPSEAIYYAHEHNALRSDALASSWLHVHQQVGAISLGTNPSNTNYLSLIINASTVVITFVTSIGSTAGNVLIGASAAATVANLVTLLQNPTVTTATGVAIGTIGSTNATLVQYLGWGLATGGTTITPFSLNTSTYAPFTSFSSVNTVSGATWTPQTMQLYVEPGTYYVGTTRVLFLGGSTPTFTAPSSHPRIDLVTADSTGTIANVTGTESATPVAPSYPANKLVLAEIYHVVGETALYDGDNQQTGQGYVYNDVRPIAAPPYVSSASQVASGLFILDPGSEVQGNIIYYNGSAWVLLAPGTAGYFLATQGTGANPQWVQPIPSTASGQSSYSGATGTQTIAHGLGRIPTFVRIHAVSSSPDNIINIFSHGDSSNVCVWSGWNNGAAAVGSSGSQAVYIQYQTGTAASYAATITMDATNIYLAWTKVGSPAAVSFLWEAQ